MLFADEKSRENIQKCKIKTYVLGLFDPSPIKARILMNLFPAEVVIFHYPWGQKYQSIIAQQLERSVTLIRQLVP